MKISLFAIMGIAFFTSAAQASLQADETCLFGVDSSLLYDAPSALTLGLTYEQAVTVDNDDGAASVSEGPNKGKSFILSDALKEQIRKVIARNYGTSTTLKDALHEMSGSSYGGALRFYSAPNPARTGDVDRFVYINFYPGDNEYGIIYQIKNRGRTATYANVVLINDGEIVSCSVRR